MGRVATKREKNALCIPSMTHRLALRAANLQAGKQVIQKGGDGSYRLMRVVRWGGSVTTLQEFIPDLFREVAPDGVRDGERLASRPGTRWCAAGTGAGVTLGEDVELRHGDVAVDGDAVLFKRGRQLAKGHGVDSRRRP